MHTIRIAGYLDVGEDMVLKFYPNIKSSLDNIKSNGWKYSFKNIVGTAKVTIDLNSIGFKLKYYPPRVERFEGKGEYSIEATVGDKPPNIFNVEYIKSFEISISTEHTWGCVSIDPINKIITYIEDVLWNGIRIGEGREPEKLSEAKEVYNVVKFFLDNKYKFKDKYVIEKYKKLVDLFEKKYTFTLTIELTIDREGDVPSWNKLKEEMSRFFYERGLLMKLEGDTDKDILSIFKKPLP